MKTSYHNAASLSLSFTFRMTNGVLSVLGRTASRPFYFCTNIITNATGLITYPISRMLPALHARSHARGLGLVRSAVKGARTLTASPSTKPTPTPSSAPSVIQELSPDVEALVRDIHATKTKAVVYATGGAVQSTSWLLTVPGASATVLETSVPYARDSLVDLLGQEPEQYCSAGTAAALAAAAYRRAASLCSFGSTFVGVGATCALATEPPKRGDHRAYLALHSAAGTRTLALTLAKGARNRVGEDDLVSRALIKMLAEACGCDISAFQLPLLPDPTTTAPSETRPPSSSSFSITDTHPNPPAAPTAADPSSATAPLHSHPHDAVHDTWQPTADPLGRLLRGDIRCVEYCGSEVVVDAPRRRRVYLPGSFNPVHEGHRELLAAAVKASGASGGPSEGAFELTVQNADKGLLSEDEIRRRVVQFVALGAPVVVSRAPLFTDKAALLPGSRFVVGYDTAVRLVLPKYYNNSYTQMLLDFSRLREAGCSFMVAGRVDGTSGRFLGLPDVDMPPELADLFAVALSEADFRRDISSTERRQMQQQQGAA